MFLQIGNYNNSSLPFSTYINSLHKIKANDIKYILLELLFSESSLDLLLKGGPHSSNYILDTAVIQNSFRYFFVTNNVYLCFRSLRNWDLKNNMLIVQSTGTVRHDRNKPSVIWVLPFRSTWSEILHNWVPIWSHWGNVEQIFWFY